jgi:acetylornithine aminotransferase
MHGTTFGGNPLACAAGLAVLNELENGVIQNAADIGSYFYKQLECLIEDGPEMVKEIRGQGLMLGVVFAFDASIVVEQLLQSKQIITNSTVTNVLRILPPLNITKEDVVFFIIALRGCLDTISSEKLHLQ